MYIYIYIYVDVLVMFNDFKRSRDIIVCFIDIGDIVDHNSLNFLFIIYIRTTCIQK